MRLLQDNFLPSSDADYLPFRVKLVPCCLLLAACCLLLAACCVLRAACCSGQERSKRPRKCFNSATSAPIQPPFLSRAHTHAH
jgi:hypothetical protein